MKLVKTAKEMQGMANQSRKNGEIICLVPTMGALHDGHVGLITEAKKRADVTVVSIFINPTQFGRNEDLNNYPMNLDTDLAKIDDLRVDVVFNPDIGEIYPESFQTYVVVEELQGFLCGIFRPGHFRGVATVVLKLFNIVKPHIALFGEKDYQQLKIIQRMVNDLNLEVEIVGFPTVRDENGLALSSRNAYLSAEERIRAASISRALCEIKKVFDTGIRRANTIIEAGEKKLKDVGIENIDYLEICDPETLRPKELAEDGDLVAVAVRLGAARLIDNTLL